MALAAGSTTKLKVAVAGCGHGTLHTIYASVEESCRVKGWDGVDLVIIGGDFQAVRNRYDLNMTAMPQKYRKMGDFHEYYSGARQAPYLTIFVGGNHEASNYLFELYYGGWVAPNIYYMGAANVLRLGPLRIAGLSGIWKGYNYRKPHFERLPYNDSEKVSIYHVRELDVRKMLSVRSQVDVGMSHDWPQGVEWNGDSRWLFQRKDKFEADAKQGRLGSVAAKHCLDRLRPTYWFSAHLHIKYAAVVQHRDSEGTVLALECRPQQNIRSCKSESSQVTPTQDQGLVDPPHHGAIPSSPGQAFLPSLVSKATSGEEVSTLGPHSSAAEAHETSLAIGQNVKQAQVSAWQNFHVDATREDTKNAERRLHASHEQTSENRRGGTSAVRYAFDETWKQVQVGDSDGRAVTSVSRSTRAPAEDPGILPMDGCNEVRSKRPRSVTPDETSKDTRVSSPLKPRNYDLGQLDGSLPSNVTAGAGTIKNEDEIEIEMSDSASEKASQGGEPSPSKLDNSLADDIDRDGVTRAGSDSPDTRAKSKMVMTEDSDGGGAKLDPKESSFAPMAGMSSPTSQGKNRDKEEDVLEPRGKNGSQDEVSDAMRARLIELSNTFGPTPAKAPPSAALPFPERIENNTTKFLALDKCEGARHFLQLLELAPISEQTGGSHTRPYKLEYDPEWLAILRVFAPELEVGGEPGGRTLPHKGDLYYREKIVEEEKWVDEHVFQTGKIGVPEDFAVTAPVYDTNEEVSVTDQPCEFVNPQTSRFCDLIGIENKLDISQEEREIRMARGPRPDDNSFHGRDRGGGRGGWRGNGRQGRGRNSNNPRRSRGRGWGGRG